MELLHTFSLTRRVYALFSAPQFAINMHLMNNGPKARFMDEIGVVFRNATLRFNTHAFKPAKLQQQLDAQLAPLGGAAIVTPSNIELELCDGHRVHIQQRFTVLWQRANSTVFYTHKASNRHPVKFFHLDVEVQVPGCHDAFDGALGQTYQCKYNAQPFRFDHAQEESFRVDSLASPSGAFARNAPCHAPSVFAGQTAMHGGSSSTADAQH